MPIKTVRAHSKIIRREGLGAQQCEACGRIYRIDHVPEVCENAECPTNLHGVEEGGYGRAKAYHTVYHLTKEQGKAVQDALKAYSTLLHGRGGIWSRREGDRIWELAKLFE